MPMTKHAPCASPSGNTYKSDRSKTNQIVSRQTNTNIKQSRRLAPLQVVVEEYVQMANGKSDALCVVGNMYKSNQMQSRLNSVDETKCE